MNDQELREALKEGIQSYNKTGHGYIGNTESNAVINSIMANQYIVDKVRRS